MEKEKYPILEFDEDRNAIINPSNTKKKINISEYCVITFFKDAIKQYLDEGSLKEISILKSETLDIPVYETILNGKNICLVQGFVGAPGSAGLLEELVALGISKFIVCGGAGVLRKDLTVGHLIIPTSAIRDEGTSYHYVKPSREIKADGAAINLIEDELTKLNIEYIKGKTWTTDAFYRETKNKVAQRVSEGCLCVEMEASAFMAVAQFRGATLGQILYGGDDVSGDEWDSRGWHTREDIRRNLVDISLEICLKM